MNGRVSVRRLGFNLLVLACAIPAALAGWAIVGELVGDVIQADGATGGPLVEAFLAVVAVLYISLLLFFLFLPGFALFLLVVGAAERRFPMSARGQRLLAVALSPIVGAVFILIPAVPQDRAGVWSGWWFILGTALIVALLARLPRPAAPPRPTASMDGVGNAA